MTQELNEVLKIFFFNIRACQSDNLKHEQNRRVALEYSLRMQTIQESRIVTRILLIIIFLAFNPRPLALESLTLSTWPTKQSTTYPHYCYYIHTASTITSKKTLSINQTLSSNQTVSDLLSQRKWNEKPNIVRQILKLFFVKFVFQLDFRMDLLFYETNGIVVRAKHQKPGAIVIPLPSITLT